MPDYKTEITYIKSLIKQITTEQLDQLDFDKLAAHLEQQKTILRQSEHLSDELALLRDDYLQRIGGMVKAIAAVEASEAKMRDALELLETATTLPSDRLIKLCRNIQSKFRDTFPLSFNHLPYTGNRHQKDYSSYK